MATGASKAKREAKKQAAKLYYEGLKEFKRIDEVKGIDTQGARKLDDDMDGNMSGRSKRLARKADKVGREINKQKGAFNEGAEKYNKRYDALQEQLKSPTGVEKGVDYAFNLEPKMRQEFSRIDSEIERLRGQGTNSATSILGHPAALSDGDRQRAQQIKALQDERDAIDRSSRGLNDSYRNLDNLELAYKEMATLAKEADGYKPAMTSQTTDTELRGLLQSPTKAFGLNAPQPTENTIMGHAIPPAEKPFDFNNMVKDESSASAAMSKFSGQYEALANKLKSSLKRDMRMASPKEEPNPTGLLASSMVIDPSANPVATA